MTSDEASVSPVSIHLSHLLGRKGAERLGLQVAERAHLYQGRQHGLIFSLDGEQQVVVAHQLMRALDADSVFLTH